LSYNSSIIFLGHVAVYYRVSMIACYWVYWYDALVLYNAELQFLYSTDVNLFPAPSNP